MLSHVRFIGGKKKKKVYSKKFMIFGIRFLEFKLDLNNERILVMIRSIFLSLGQAHGI